MSSTESDHPSFDQIREAAVGRADKAVARHLSECSECQELHDAWREWAAPPGVQVRAFDECLTPEEMNALIQGSEHARLDHVASCHRCATILREALDDAPLSGEAAAVVRRLNSSRSQWRRAMAARFVSEGPQTRYWSRWAVIAASFLIPLSGILFWLARPSQNIDGLLARSYSDARPFEFRLPDAGYSAPLQHRSAAPSAFDKSSALVEAENAIRARLSKSPDNPQTLLWKGEAEVLGGDFDAAIGSLKRAEQLNRSDPLILIALGSAYSAKGDSEDYPKAVDSFRRAENSAYRAIATFNLALVLERMSLLPDAIEQWDQYLKIDARSPWAGEARAHRQHLEDLRKSKQGRFISPAPADFLVHLDAAASHAEAFFAPFWETWLPAAPRDAAARSAAYKLADLVRRRARDTLFFDALASIDRRDALPALTNLSAAIASNRAGRHDAAAPSAAAADRQFARAAQTAGSLRARLELVYALHRKEDSASCIAAAESLWRDLGKTSYVWLRGQARLELAICYHLAGRVAISGQLIEAGLPSLEHSFYSTLYLRALGLSLEAKYREGGPVSVFSRVPAAMKRYWDSAAPPVQEHQFLYDLSEAGSAMELPVAASLFAGAATRVSTDMPSRYTEGLTRVWYARHLQEAGDTQGARRQLRLAEAMLFGASHAGEVYRTDALVSIAQQYVEQNDAADALRSLDRLERGVGQLSTLNQLRYFESLGSARYLLGETRTAIDAWKTAARIQEQWLPGQDTRSRMASASAMRPVYAALASAEPDRTRALEHWLHFLALAENEPQNSKFPAVADRSLAVLVFAVTRTALLAWLIDSKGVDGKVFAPPPEVEASTRRLAWFCSQPDSEITTIERDGKLVYDALLRPFEARLKPATRWVLVPDSWIASVPFGALPLRDGHFASEEHDIVLAGFPTADFEVGAGRDLVSGPARLVVAPSAVTPEGRRLPYLSDARQEALEAASRLPRAVVVENGPVNGGYAPALFHFAGHGWSNGGDGALLAADGTPVTADEIASFDWHGCGLVVLSACLTASGEERGPVNPRSLVRAFLAAGAKRVIAARWTVDSGITRRLMHHFYARLAESSSIAEALSGAQRAVMSDRRFRHPYYWAGFQQYGEL